MRVSDKGCRDEPDPAASPRPPGEIRRGGDGGGVLFAPCPDCAQFGSSHPAGSLLAEAIPAPGRQSGTQRGPERGISPSRLCWDERHSPGMSLGIVLNNTIFKSCYSGKMTFDRMLSYFSHREHFIRAIPSPRARSLAARPRSLVDGDARHGGQVDLSDQGGQGEQKDNVEAYLNALPVYQERQYRPARAKITESVQKALQVYGYYQPKITLNRDKKTPAKVVIEIERGTRDHLAPRHPAGRGCGERRGVQRAAGQAAPEGGRSPTTANMNPSRRISAVWGWPAAI